MRKSQKQRTDQKTPEVQCKRTGLPSVGVPRHTWVRVSHRVSSYVGFGKTWFRLSCGDPVWCYVGFSLPYFRVPIVTGLPLSSDISSQGRRIGSLSVKDRLTAYEEPPGRFSRGTRISPLEGLREDNRKGGKVILKGIRVSRERTLI